MAERVDKSGKVEKIPGYRAGYDDRSSNDKSSYDKSSNDKASYNKASSNKASYDEASDNKSSGRKSSDNGNAADNNKALYNKAVHNKELHSKTAVALAYNPEEAAPKIIASGRGYLADKILQKADQNKIPVHKDEQLASTLSKLEVGDYIPPELYEVVSEILLFVDNMDRIKAKVLPKEV